MIAIISDQSVPLYASYLSYRPQSLYLFATPEMQTKLRWAKHAFSEAGLQVYREP